VRPNRRLVLTAFGAQDQGDFTASLCRAPSTATAAQAGSALLELPVMFQRGNSMHNKLLAGSDDRPVVQELLKNLAMALPRLEKLLEECSGHWGYEDPIYRFYHQSFKVYQLQAQTLEIVAHLKALLPDADLHEWFLQIISEGTDKTFAMDDNAQWLVVTRPIVEAFFHARYFLEMAVTYGKELFIPPRVLPSGWAAVLSLYNLR
jgi:hypothetical protein